MLRSLRSRLLSISIVCLLQLVAHACTCQSPLLVKVGRVKGFGCGLFMLAEEWQLFEKHGLKLDSQEFSTLAQAQTALARNPRDFLCSSLADLVLFDKLEAWDMKVILIPAASRGADVLIARKDVGNQLTDLKGARIGVSASNLGEPLLSRALARSSLDREDFTVLAEPVETILESLRSSEIQLAVASAPLSLEILKNPEMMVLFHSGDMPGEMIETLSVKSSTLRQHPELQSRLASVWSDLLQQMAQRPTEAQAFIGKLTGMSLDSSSLPYQLFNTTEQQDYLKPEGRLLVLAEDLQKNLQELGLLKLKRDSRLFLAIP